MWLGIWLLVGSVTFLASRRNGWSWSNLLPTIKQWIRIKDVTDRRDAQDCPAKTDENRVENTPNNRRTHEEDGKVDERKLQFLPLDAKDKTSESHSEAIANQQVSAKASDSPASSSIPQPSISVSSAAAKREIHSASASQNNPANELPLPPKPPLSVPSLSKPSQSATTLMPPPPAPSRPALAGPSNRPSPATPRISTTNRNLLQSPNNAPAPRRKQTPLTLGHSPLDWAALTQRPNEATAARLRGRDATELCAAAKKMYLRVPPSMLRHHDGRNGRDAWTSFSGRVYNITAYIPFHPGGRGELMRCAGKDGRKLFDEVHPWVNWEGMLGECFVGMLVAENAALEGEESGKMDEMD